MKEAPSRWPARRLRTGNDPRIGCRRNAIPINDCAGGNDICWIRRSVAISQKKVVSIITGGASRRVFFSVHASAVRLPAIKRSGRNTRTYLRRQKSARRCFITRAGSPSGRSAAAVRANPRRWPTTRCARMSASGTLTFDDAPTIALRVRRPFGRSINRRLTPFRLAIYDKRKWTSKQTTN